MLSIGIRLGKVLFKKLKALHGMEAKTMRKFKEMTNSVLQLSVAPNLIDRECSSVLPNQVCIKAITYLATDESWLCLTVMVD